MRRDRFRRDVAAWPRSHGFTLVELLVGTAVGLVIVAGTLALVVRELAEHRAVRLEARLTQDLRHAAAIVANDLRRAGHWQGAASGLARADGSAGAVNPYRFDVGAAAASAVAIRYSRDAVENDAVDGNEQFGFRLRNGTIELQLGDANWQALTDPGTVVVTAFDVVPRIDEVGLAAFCSEPCAPGNAACPPRQQVVGVEVAVAGRSVSDAAVVRRVTSSARLRHAPIVGRCEE